MIKSALQSSLTNDVKYRNLGASNLPSSEYLIQSTVLASPAASVTLSDLGQWAGVYKDLRVVGVWNQNTTGGAVELSMRFNGDTGSNYSWQRMTGNGSAVTGGQSLNTNFLFVGVVPLYGTSDIFASATIDILEAYNTSKLKTVRSLSGITGSTSEVHLHAGTWNNTAAISSITFQSTFNSSFRAGTRFSVYGVTA